MPGAKKNRSVRKAVWAVALMALTGHRFRRGHISVPVIALPEGTPKKLPSTKPR